jgi:asparagine synthase (glutamine-hydrolysing)
MCGIAGILNLDGSPCDPLDVHCITEALAHRGPDGSGIHTDGCIGLGHRRLAILDLSDSGKQPLTLLEGRYWITYNGEVYNFLELRKELEGLGQRFTSDSDTEVIVAAYHHWGADCVLKFNGMWAFAIWDSHRRELFLSRDRFGIKPLHYLAEPGRFVFASELKSFLCLRGFTPRENQDEMRRMLSTGVESHEDTLLQGVKLLLPGHNMLVSASGTRIWRWWRTLDHLTGVPKRFSEQAELFRELFFDACRLRLRSDVPVATCLSGGLDSSSILCSIAAMHKLSVSRGTSQRLTSDFHRAFVATFAGTPLDEQEYADAAIQKAGADPRYRPMRASAMIEDLHRYAYDFEMIGNSLLIPVWSIYRELRRDGVVVSLDGLGSDELLGGYGRTLRSLMRAHTNLLRAPSRTLDVVRTFKGMRGSRPGTESFTALLIESDPFLRKLRRTAVRTRQFMRRMERQSAAPVFKLASDPLWGAPSTACDFDAFDAEERSAMNSLTPLNRLLYYQVHHQVNQSILRKYDRLSMAHGIEVRLPFLDWRLVCYAFSLPDESKVGGGVTKRILREAMRGVLPEKVRTRKPKIGFDSPMQTWLNGDLGDWVWERANSKRFLESDIWDGAAIRDFIATRHRSKTWTEEDGRRVWHYLQADLWRETFFERTAELRALRDP